MEGDLKADNKEHYMENSIMTVIISAAVSLSISLLSKLFDYFTERKEVSCI